jgi:hypothetical protein
MDYLEHANVEGEAAQIGRDPRKMTEADLNALGHSKRPLLAAMRQNCIAAVFRILDSKEHFVCDGRWLLLPFRNAVPEQERNYGHLRIRQSFHRGPGTRLANYRPD